MKKVLVFMVALLLGWGNMVMATEVEASSGSASMLTLDQGLNLHVDLGDMTDKDEAMIEAEIAALFDANLLAAYADLQCKVTVSGQVNIGVAKVTIEVEVSGSCAEISRQGKMIANMVLQAVKSELQKATIF